MTEEIHEKKPLPRYPYVCRCSMEECLHHEAGYSLTDGRCDRRVLSEEDLEEQLGPYYRDFSRGVRNLGLCGICGTGRIKLVERGTYLRPETEGR